MLYVAQLIHLHNLPLFRNKVTEDPYQSETLIMTLDLSARSTLRPHRLGHGGHDDIRVNLVSALAMFNFQR